ncbi:GNAT family N-acetyltransferase [Sporosarcina sp. P26b]|uniref:GNAT family N-acetyltransferase n=1 Tax=Sporosarcina ureae TaxID=1571 RepID=UPI000A19C9D4|nr:GNAT family N-acetyltransferase [Sporosarcina ureae]PIC72246.1 GNAT family N-acetyltransferase [Sporosarcina sp. P17b]PIC97003.1 GNAT family N-acetyltransferase [Sporosarcina sp. P26b]
MTDRGQCTKHSVLIVSHNLQITVKIVTDEKGRQDAYAVRQKVFVEEQGVPLILELDEYDQDAIHFVAYDEADQPIGAGRMRGLVNAHAKAERICILPEHRGKHLGNLIMNALEEHARNKSMKKLLLNAQSYAVPFYEKLGYVVTSPEFMDADIPHRAMEKDLRTT